MFTHIQQTTLINSTYETVHSAGDSHSADQSLDNTEDQAEILNVSLRRTCSQLLISLPRTRLIRELSPPVKCHAVVASSRQWLAVSVVEITPLK